MRGRWGGEVFGCEDSGHGHCFRESHNIAFPLVFTQGSGIQLVSALAQGCCKEAIKKAQRKAKRASQVTQW